MKNAGVLLISGIIISSIVSMAFCSDVNTVSFRPDESEKKQLEEIRKNFQNSRNKNLIDASCWTLIHCAEFNQIEEIDETMTMFAALISGEELTDTNKAVGVVEFKRRIAQLLKNDDIVVRGFGAITLGITGDKAYSKDIAQLLRDKQKKAQGDSFDALFPNYDRSRAAMALGLLGAEEYKKDLGNLLKSPDADDRAGATLGLGYMGAKEYIKDIAALLNDEEDKVKVAAMMTLTDLGAKEYSNDIAKLLDSSGDQSVYETACYCLARLDARENAKDIAKLLGQEFRKGTAAKALAIMGAREYAKDIAKLLDDRNSAVRHDAIVALGLLDANEYADLVARHLKDEEEYVRPYAAFALLLMDADNYASDIIKVVDSEGKGTANVYLDLHSSITKEEYINSVRAKAQKSFERMKKKQNTSTLPQ